MSALLPLWVAVLYIGRWHDVQHTTIAAARYAAFESHVAAGLDSTERVAAITRERLFPRDAGRFRSSERSPTAAPIGDLPEWRDPLRHGALIDVSAGPAVAIATLAQPQAVERAEATAFAIIQPALAAGEGTLDLQRDAARRATVSVPLRPFTVPGPVVAVAPPAGTRIEAEGFLLRESLALLVDPWAASSWLRVRQRTAALSVAGPLRDLTEPLRPLRWAAALLEPGIERLCLGRIEPDIVPPDRLVGGSGLRSDLRAVRCD